MNARVGSSVGVGVALSLCAGLAAAEGQGGPARARAAEAAPAVDRPVLRLEFGSGWVAAPLLAAGSAEVAGSFPLDRHGARLPQTTSLGPLVRVGLAAGRVRGEGKPAPVAVILDDLQRALARSLFAVNGLRNGVDALLEGRALDQNNDALADSGADFWSAYLFHTRDVVRQSMLDYT